MSETLELQRECGIAETELDMIGNLSEMGLSLEAKNLIVSVGRAAGCGEGPRDHLAGRRPVTPAVPRAESPADAGALRPTV